MAKAFKCDLCGKYTDYVRTVGGVSFKIGEIRDEFTGTRDKVKIVEEVCLDCYEKISEKVKEVYENSKE